MKALGVSSIKPRHLIIMALQIIFVAVFCYLVYYMYNLYQNVYADTTEKPIGNSARTNLNAYKQAVERFQNAREYVSPVEVVPTPFKVPPKPEVQSF